MCRIAFLLLVPLLGCGPQSGDHLHPTCTDVFFADADGDGHGDASAAATACSMPSGYVATDDDCDDADGSIHPGANEVCNGLDDDCDTRIDVDAVDIATWYADADLDGFGDEGATTIACAQPEGSLSVAGDCADDDAEINPDADERCNDVDDDCDGLVDGDDDDLVDGLPFYADADGDGRGDADAVVYDCSIPTGYSDDAEDCDDGDPTVGSARDYYTDDDGDEYGDGAPVETCTPTATQVPRDGDCSDTDESVHPGATESCDGKDNDCDGLSDDDDPHVVGTTWYADDDGDGYGGPYDTNSCVAPSGYIAVGGDCDDTSSAIHPDATELCVNGVDDDCGTDPDERQIPAASADFMAVGSAWGWFGTDSDVADADADGVSDLLVGSAEDLALYVVYGPASGTTTTASLVALRADTTIPSFGDVVGAGDANDDGVDDVLAGSSYIYSDGTSYLFLGPITADRGTTDADAVLAGPSDSWAGCYLDVVGDFDGDGASDVAIGAPGDTGVLATAYVVTGPTSGAIDLAADAAYLYEGASARDSDLGLVQHVGDMNADGIDDFALDDWSGPGTVYLIEGGSAPGTYAVDVAASATLEGRERGAYFGSSMKSVDYDADGTLDLIIGAAGADSLLRNGGAVFAFLGPLSGSLDGRDATAVWVPDVTIELLGNDIAVGDVDGDANADLLLGAPWSAGSFDGEMFLQLGPASGVVEVNGLPSFRGGYAEELGSSVAIVPDWTGDGRDEVATATVYHPDAAGDLIGALWVFDSESIFGL